MRFVSPKEGITQAKEACGDFCLISHVIGEIRARLAYPGCTLSVMGSRGENPSGIPPKILLSGRVRPS
jgi:hypothetical protein